MTASIIAFSDTGYLLGERLLSFFSQGRGTASLTRCPAGGLQKWAADNFHNDAMVFISSCGIATRAIAPLLENKTSDPAVVVIDELGLHSIALLSGHIGGGNELAVRLGRFLGAEPVITTATDIHGTFAVDTWACKNGLGIANPQRIKNISSRLLAGKTITLQTSMPISGALPDSIVLGDKDSDMLVTYNNTGGGALLLVPPVATLGIGCKKGASVRDIEEAFALTLKKANLHPLAVRLVCSINLKKKEPGVLEFCSIHRLPYQTFTAGELAAADGEYNSSDFVKQVTGVDNVCERSAILGSGKDGRLLLGKTVTNGVTMALAISPFLLNFSDEVQYE